MHTGRTIEEALNQTVLNARQHASAAQMADKYCQDLFVEEGIYSYDLTTAGLWPGTDDSHRTQYAEKQREVKTKEKGDHQSHSADHEWNTQRAADHELTRVQQVARSSSFHTFSNK
jgi:hypothetical protein